ncbi:MAG: GNAT family N-acetyltransferase [Gammaproteobacteria bacterium]|nr:GNAT family N-acetyltransferase [Gammaproteobacteria bacterium]
MSRDFSVRIESWPAAREAACRVRYTVFVEEQQVPPEIELDEWDAASEHAIATDASGRAIATGRLLPDGHIGRMAVLRDWRGCGVGAAVLAALLARAGELGIRDAILNAQTHARGFYARFGFAQTGAEFMEAGIPHITMALRLDARK